MSGTAGSTSQSRIRTSQHHEQSKGCGIPVKACIKCGSVWKRVHYCKAEKNTCNSCGKMGHLTECCLFKKIKQPKPSPRANSNDTRRRNYHAGPSPQPHPRTLASYNDNHHYNKENANADKNGNLRKTEAKSQGKPKLSQEDQYKESISHYTRLIKLCPMDPQNYNNRSVCYMMTKQYENALGDASKVIQLNPSSVESYCRLIRCAIILGCTMEAAVHIKKLSQLDPENKSLLIERKKLNELEGYIKRERKAVQSENYGEALESVCESLIISSESQSLMIKKAEYLMMLKRYEESEKIVKQILEKDENNVQAKYILGIKMYDLDVDGAVKYFKEILELDPGHSKARDRYEKARRISNKKKQGNDAFLNKNFKAAHNVYSSALAIDPDHTNMKIKLYFNMGQASWNLKKYDRAIAEYERVVNTDPQHFPALKQRGKCYLEMSKYKEAIADFSKVLTLNPKDPDCLKLINDAASPMLSFAKRDPYEVLGVRRDASIEEIKQVYEHKELLHYLNRVVNTTEEQQTKYDNDFKEVTLAYHYLLEKIEKRTNSTVEDPCTKLYNLFDG